MKHEQKAVSEIYRDHQAEIDDYAREHGMDPRDLGKENIDKMTREWMAATNYRPPRPSWLKQLISRIRTWLNRHGILVHHLSDDDILTILARAAKAEVARRRGKSAQGNGVRFAYNLENAMPSKEKYRVERVNKNAGAEFNGLDGVVCRDLPGAENWSKEEWRAYMIENHISGKHSVPALGGREAAVRENLPKRLMGHSAYQDKMSIVSVIPEMLKNAVLVQTEELPREGHREGMKSHILAAKVRFGDRDSASARRYIVGIVIHEDGNGNLYYDHELTDIKNYADSAANQGHNLAGTPSTSVMNIIQKALLSSGFDGKNEKNTRFSIDDDGAGFVEPVPFTSTIDDSRGKNIVAMLRPIVGKVQSGFDKEALARNIKERYGVDVPPVEALLWAREAAKQNFVEEMRRQRKVRDEWLYNNNLLWKQAVDYAGSENFKVRVSERMNDRELSGTFWLKKGDEKSANAVIDLDALASELCGSSRLRFSSSATRRVR